MNEIKTNADGERYLSGVSIHTPKTHSVQTHLLYIQVGDVHVHQTALYTLHHTIFLEVTEEVPHDRRRQAADPLAQDVRLQTLQEDAFSHRVLHQPRVDLVKQQVPEK